LLKALPLLPGLIALRLPVQLCRSPRRSHLTVPSIRSLCLGGALLLSSFRLLPPRRELLPLLPLPCSDHLGHTQLLRSFSLGPCRSLLVGPCARLTMPPLGLGRPRGRRLLRLRLLLLPPRRLFERLRLALLLLARFLDALRRSLRRRPAEAQVESMPISSPVSRAAHIGHGREHTLCTIHLCLHLMRKRIVGMV
jgi:hypothetical protein